MESLKSTILTVVGITTLLLFVALSYNNNQFLFTELITASVVIGCLLLIKVRSQGKVIYTTSTTTETENTEKTKKTETTKTPEHEFSESYSEQYF